jgi:DNA polymerase III epsilon subunit-like protein
MNFIGLDIETTGLEIEQFHRLIQIGVAFNRHTVRVYDVKPKGFINYQAEAMAVNRFTVERIEKAAYQDRIDEVLEAACIHREYATGSLTAVGWNVGGFDMTFVKRELPRTARFFSHRVVDLSGICMLIGGEKWRELKAAEHELIAKELGHQNWHDAGYDALAALMQWQRWQRWFSERINGQS